MSDDERGTHGVKITLRPYHLQQSRQPIQYSTGHYQSKGRYRQPDSHGDHKERGIVVQVDSELDPVNITSDVL